MYIKKNVDNAYKKEGEHIPHQILASFQKLRNLFKNRKISSLYFSKDTSRDDLVTLWQFFHVGGSLADSIRVNDFPIRYSMDANKKDAISQLFRYFYRILVEGQQVRPNYCQELISIFNNPQQMIKSRLAPGEAVMNQIHRICQRIEPLINEDSEIFRVHTKIVYFLTYRTISAKQEVLKQVHVFFDKDIELSKAVTVKVEDYYANKLLYIQPSLQKVKMIELQRGISLKDFLNMLSCLLPLPITGYERPSEYAKISEKGFTLWAWQRHQ